jgi:DNA-binding LytR/AlgR family response regulator
MKTLRVLIVEDEPLIALDLESIVTDSVSAAVIVKSSVESAKKVLSSKELDSRIDLAFLDIDVTNGKTFGLASILAHEHIPYAFVSGSRADELPLELQKMPFFGKPAGRSEIEDLLKAVSASPRVIPQTGFPLLGEDAAVTQTPSEQGRLTMAIGDDFVRHLEAEMAEIERHLRPLKSGSMIIRQGPRGFMDDVTAREVTTLKNAYRRIEIDIAQYRDMI